MVSKENNIVLIGETGCGKSTFINYLANLFHGGSIHDLKVAIPTQFYNANMDFHSNERALNDESKSKTVECHPYTFKVEEEEINFHFIDTPGINDTNGSNQDDKNIENIVSYIQTLHSLTAIFFIFNDSQIRLTPSIQYAMERLLSQIPRSINDNMVMIRTNWSGYKKKFRPTDFGLPENCPVFYMQNSAYVRDPRDLHTREIIQLQASLDDSMRTLNQVIKHVLNLIPISIQNFKDMYDERNAIKILMHQSKMILCELQELETKIALLEETAKIYHQNAAQFDQYINTTTVTVFEQTTTPYHNTLCANCNYVCHENCQLNETNNQGHEIFVRCLSIKDGFCTKCPYECSYQRHYHARKLIKPVSRSISNVIEPLKERYIAAQIGKQETNEKVGSFEVAKNAIEHELHFQYCQIEDNVKKLQESCPNVNVVSELMQMIDDLQAETVKLKSESATHTAGKFIQKLKELCDCTSTKVIVDDKSSVKCQKTSAQSSKQLINTDLQCLTNSVSASYDGQEGSLKADISPSNTVSMPIQSNEQFNEMTSTKEELLDKMTDTDSLVSYTTTSTLTSCSNLSISIDMQPDYAEYSTTRLIQIIQNLPQGKKSKDYNEIKSELERRCEGKSIGYLDINQQLILCEQFKILSTYNTEKLLPLYWEMQETIRKYTQGRAMKIEAVPFKCLARITAIVMIGYGKSNESDK